MVAGIAARAAAQPSAWALADGSMTLTWAELNGTLNHAVNALLAADLGPERRVAIVAENSAGCAIAHLAVILAGASAVPVDHHLRAAETGYILRDSEARLVLAGPQSAVAARQTAWPAARVVAWGMAGRSGIESFADLMAAASGAEPPADLRPRRALMYTSGTVGPPKATEQPEPIFAGGDTIAEHAASLAAGPVAGLGPHLVAGPLHHTGPLHGLRCLAGGTATVVMPRFDPTAALAAIDRYRIATSTMVPAHFVRLLALPSALRGRYDVRSLRRITHTSAPCPPDVKRAMIEWMGPVFVEAYSSTEIGTVAVIDSADWLTHPGSVGRARPPFEITIRDAAGGELPPGTEGLVCVRNPRDGGPQYWHNREQTAASFLGDDQFIMGEVGTLDTDGYLYLTDRAADRVVSGGVYVYPREPEAVLAAHPGVRDVAVIGVPDPDLGESLLALVVAGRGGLTGSELISWCRDRLTHRKCPRAVLFLPELPRTAMGKLSKRQLRAQYGGAPQ